MTSVDGSDWVRPSARRAPSRDADGTAGASPEQAPAARRTRAETQAARQAGKTGQTAKPTRGARGAAPAQPAAPPEVPAWHEEPTQPQPVVRVERGSRRGSGDGDSGRGRGGGGGGGGRGDGNGSGPTGGPSQADRRNFRVAVVLGVLILPFVAAAIWVVVQIAPSGGPTKKTAPTAPAGQLQLLLRPGLNLSQIGEVIATLPGHTKAAFVAQANSGTIRSQYEPATVKSPEGVMFPDTYFVLANESDASILRRLVNRFDQIGDQIGLGSTTNGLTPYQTIIVASLIQQEAKLPSDGPLVAAVILNRIKAHMPLQIDATLCYVKGGCPPVPTAADKKINSPYNTYLVTGLPPTPIASVSQASLQAAMQPTPNVAYLYYVIADSSGKLAFANTLTQQNANIAAAHRKGLL